jgi:hypothetical protein
MIRTYGRAPNPRDSLHSLHRVKIALVLGPAPFLWCTAYSGEGIMRVLAIHPSAWKANSANFACCAFSEVR